MPEKLKKLLQNSHSPYYKYKVAAIIECKDGKTFEGVNIETSSPASGVCAERNAIYSAISHGYKKGDFKHLYIMNSSDKECYPCFVCRQTLMDFCENIEITTYTKEGKNKTVNLKELCPYPFESSDIKWKADLSALPEDQTPGNQP